MRIAVADDEMDIRAHLRRLLTAAGHDCFEIANGRDVVSALTKETFDVVLLDWNMPHLTGLEVIAWARENLEPCPPIVVLTARDDKADIVAALEAGAVDFIVKPEDDEIVRVRVEAAGRRIKKPPSDRFAQYGGYRFDYLGRSVSYDGADCARLTAKEFALAALLFENLNRPLSRGYLQSQIWGNVADLETRTLDMHISRIRSKLALRPEHGFAIQSVFGFGYRLDSFAAGVG